VVIECPDVAELGSRPGPLRLGQLVADVSLLVTVMPTSA